jgi:outer membrane protein assembly factor BamB
VTWRDRVYVTCYTGYGIDADEPGDMQNLERHLLCIRRSDGELLWKATMRSKAAVQAYQGSLLEHGYATHTPTVDSEGVYVFYGSSGAASYTHAGEPRWQTSCGSKVHGYGSASSPILSDNVLIVSAHVESESIIGLDTRNGRELWRVEATRQVWCTPIIARNADKAELVCFQEKRSVAGLNPANGRKLWSYQTSTADVQRVASGPVKYKNAIITSQGGWGANSFRFGGTGNVTDSHRQWNSTAGIYGIPLIFQDQLVAPFRGTVRICDAKKGPGRDQYIRLNPSKDGYASSVIADDKLYRVYKEDGVCVVQLGQEPKQIAHNVLEGDTSFFNATPAISNGQLFLRSDKFLYCIEKKSQ